MNGLTRLEIEPFPCHHYRSVRMKAEIFFESMHAGQNMIGRLKDECAVVFREPDTSQRGQGERLVGRMFVS